MEEQKYVKLSILNDMEKDEIINYLIDNNYKGIINDIPEGIKISYDLCEIEFVWDNLRKLI